MGSFIAVLRAARVRKLVPLWLLVLAGVLAAPTSVRLDAVVVAAVGIVAASLGAMHLNVFTDAELDARRKPELSAWMATAGRSARAVVAVEYFVAVIAAAVLASLSETVWVAVLVYTVAGALYSFNFLSRHPGRDRLKGTWWGHALAMGLVYISVWMTGVLCCERASVQTLGLWLPPIFLTAASDYALFVAESAGDATEEHAAGLRTLAARCGRQGSQQIAAGIAFVALIGLWAAVPPSLFQRALLPGAVASAALNVGLALYDDRIRAAKRERLLDVVFVASRVVLLGLLFLGVWDSP